MSAPTFCERTDGPELGLLSGFSTVSKSGASRDSGGSSRAQLLMKRFAAGAFCLAAVVVAGYFLRSFFHGDTVDDAYYTTYICTETGKVFRHKNVLGETLPIYSRYSGKNTGMPAEACYWTADGHPKTDPTWVLLNEEQGKSGPTFCPDCGRLVVGHNPRPGSGVKPPPNRAEFAARAAAQRVTKANP
jgi:hypothetical protein